MARNNKGVRIDPAAGVPEETPSDRAPSAGATAKALWVGVALLGLVWLPQHLAPAENPLQLRAASISSTTVRNVPAQTGTQSQILENPKRADFAYERVSSDVRHVADWVVDSGDNRDMAFLIVDKTYAKVFVFEPSGRIRGAAPALLGSARGDDSVPGIGDREMSNIRPEERTTPAGRFVAERGRNSHGEDIVWVDYDAAVSLHRVRANNPAERRLERLASPTPEDNRISYGCINVPVQFYDLVVSPAFTGSNGIVYVLPETRSARQVFGSYDVDDVDERVRRYTAGHPMRARVAPVAYSGANP